jgi:uncharacterized protein YegL
MLKSTESSLFSINHNIYSGYSEYWRKNKATIEHVEMAYSLRALRKVGQYIAANMKTVEWLGMSKISGDKLFLDSSFIKGEYPVPPGKMDILIGITAHEAFHCKELSDWVWIKVEEKTKDLPQKYKKNLHRLIQVGEDIYVKEIAQETIWKHYLEKAWGYCIPKETRDLSLPPTAECLFQIWEEIVVEGKLSFEINYHHDYLKPLNILLSYVEKIITYNGNKNSPMEKSEYRSNLYLEIWDKIYECIQDWEYEAPFDPSGVNIPDEVGHNIWWWPHIPHSDSKGENVFNEAEGPSKEVGENEVDDFIDKQGDDFGKLTEIKPMDIMPHEQVSRLKASLNVLEKDKNKDLNSTIEVITGEVITDLLETRFWNSTMPCNRRSDSLLVKRLKRIFEAQISKTPRLNRGLHSGKIDGRRLYRTPLSGKVFKQREMTIKDAWNITILVDASLSMSGVEGKEWELTESAFVSLYEAIKSSRNKLDILCYFERAKYCEIFRLLHHDKLYSVIPNGRTPTGQGIIAAALTIPKDKRRLILHITDGEPNSGGITVESAVKHCKKEGIELITIGCGYNEQLKEKFQNQYKEDLLLIDTIDQLPFGLETLLRKKLLARV